MRDFAFLREIGQYMTAAGAQSKDVNQRLVFTNTTCVVHTFVSTRWLNAAWSHQNVSYQLISANADVKSDSGWRSAGASPGM